MREDTEPEITLGRRELLATAAGGTVVGTAGCSRARRADGTPAGTPVAVASVDGGADSRPPVGFDAPDAFCRYPDRAVTTSVGDEPTASLDLSCVARGDGRFRLAGGAVARGRWSAPTDGQYRVAAVYGGHGRYSYDAPETGNVVASLSSGIVVRPADSDRVLEQHTVQDVGTVPGDSVAGRLRDAVQFALDRVQPEDLGPFARWVGRQSARLVEGLLGVELAGAAEDGFPAADRGPLSTGVWFDAEAGREYVFEYTPRALLVGELDTESRFEATAEATYEPRGFRVRQR